MTTLNAFLLRERRVLAERWTALALATYPPPAARAYAGDQDPFRNPVGHTLRTSLEGVVDEVLGDYDEARVARLLDPVIRIRAVQSFTPEEAVGFVFLLKRVIRDVAQVVRGNTMDASELTLVDDRIDRAALAACHLFSACQRQIASLRARERRRRRVDLHAGGTPPAQPQEPPSAGDSAEPASEPTP